VLARLHLVRHGEVHNPHGIVYAGLAGYHLSDTGRIQARQAAEHLAALEPDLLRTSPLDRAVETARPIAAATGLVAEPDAGLTEWGLARRWAGQAWEAVDADERRAYRDHPDDLPFSPEQAGEVAERMATVVDRLGAGHPGASAVLVTHQDPMQALRLHLTGRPLRSMMQDEPGHCEVISLESQDEAWIETARWRPAAPSAAFPPAE
jgi:broad specificity phosphatase PhoE